MASKKLPDEAGTASNFTLVLQAGASALEPEAEVALPTKEELDHLRSVLLRFRTALQNEPEHALVQRDALLQLLDLNLTMVNVLERNPDLGSELNRDLRKEDEANANGDTFVRIHTESGLAFFYRLLALI